MKTSGETEPQLMVLWLYSQELLLLVLEGPYVIFGDRTGVSLLQRPPYPLYNLYDPSTRSADNTIWVDFSHGSLWFTSSLGGAEMLILL